MVQEIEKKRKEIEETHNKKDNNKMIDEQPKINDPLNALIGLLDVIKSIFR